MSGLDATRGTRTVDVEATDVAMRVRDLLNTPTFLRDHGGRELVARLEASISPQSAEARALIATAQAASRWTADDADEPRLREQAHASIDRALAIDLLCGEAHKARYLLAPPAGHFVETEARLLQASRAVPTNGEVHWALCQLRLVVGRVREAATHAEAAYRVDPLRPPNVTAYGVSLHALGETESALGLLEDAVARWPDDPTVLALASWAGPPPGTWRPAGCSANTRSIRASSCSVGNGPNPTPIILLSVTRRPRRRRRRLPRRRRRCRARSRACWPRARCPRRDAPQRDRS